MAPKKKSKKPAANPARGFATTSTASKTKADDSEATEQVESLQDGESAIRPQPSDSLPGQTKPEAEKAIIELTPEQLEAQLEEADLQNLIDANREKCQKDVTRLVSRLKTERRLARPSAERVDLRKWFPDEVRGPLINSIRQQVEKAFTQPIPEGLVKSLDVLENDLVIRIWALKQALDRLGFVEDKADKAIAHLLSNANVFVSAQARTGKESLWGLDECIDWLAFNCNHDEMPGYDSHITPQVQKLEEMRMKELVLEAEKQWKEEKAAGKRQKKALGDTASNTNGDAAYSEEERHSSDSDIEPSRQLEKYLQFKTRLHKRRPDLTEVNVPRGKNTKGVRKPSPKPVDRKSSKLIRRIHALERDLLFDVEEARQRWVEMRVQLVREQAQKEREDASTKNATAAKEPTPSTQSAPMQSEEDDSIGLGEFFASLPEPPVGTNVGNESSTIIADGSTISIRDFGATTGMSPRRVLEEACRARDPGSKISFTLLSVTTFYCRHGVSVNWSKDQEIPYKVELQNIDQIFSPKQVSAKMNGVACPDKIQSEAYISVIALFTIFSSSAKEDKAYLRLPAAWRDLWSECEAVRKDQIDAADRETLRSIRNTIHTHYAGSTTWSASKSTNGNSSAENDASRAIKTAEKAVMVQEEPSIVAEDWQVRATSPAFQTMLDHRMNLPIWAYKHELLSIIQDSQVVIVCGETGCGKSTQLPAYILEQSLSQGNACKIYCTQPRRISAISLARRVSEELGERKHDVGTSRSLVGYAIRLESQMTARTRLVYATTGIVMRMLEKGSQLEGITHIVLDEVHERNIDSDFLLIVLKRLMLMRPDLKVVLMSATVDADQFSAYFGGVPVVNIPGRTFPVEERFLEDAIEESGYGLMKDQNQKEEGLDLSDDEPEDSKLASTAEDLSAYSLSTRNTLKQYNEYRINYDLMLRILEDIAQKPKFVHYSKAILVFLPGMGEIRRLNDMLAGHQVFLRGWVIIPLHSTISTEDQEKAFVMPPRGVRKIVLATNIAETGITIPDVTCVIDTGKHREMRFDERRQLSRLIETFISRANAKQRRGRAGRVQNGLCFHLFTKHRHDNLMSDAQTPEMLRLSLQDLALRVRICNLGEIEQVLGEALSPPLPKNVRRAVDSLIEVRALTVEQQLTTLGRRLATLPLDVYLGKLILLSCVFGCLDAGLTIAATLSAKSPFTAPVNASSQADRARLAFKKGNSDLITVYNAYCAWRRTCQTNGASELHFCRRNFLNAQTLSSIEELKAQLATSLADAGFLQLDAAMKTSLNRVRYHSRQRHFLELPAHLDANGSNTSIVNSVIAWSFYPKLLTREGKGYRNVANNQIVSVHPGSVNKATKPAPQFMSFYHIMQASSKAYHAHETNAVEDLAVAIACGDGDFKPYSGVLVIDGNRLRFSVSDWQSMLLLRGVRDGIREITSSSMRSPGKELSETQRGWYEAWQTAFARTDEQV